MSKLYKYIHLRFLLIIIFLLILQIASFSNNIKAIVHSSSFFSTKQGPYVEVYLTISGKSVKFLPNENNAFQGKIKVNMLLRNDSGVVNEKTYILLSTEVKDTSDILVNFVERQRLLVDNGNYVFEMKLTDLNRNSPELVYSEKINIDYPEDKVSMSDIQLIESYTPAKAKSIYSKNGYDLIPYQDYFYPDEKDKLTFYTELYNTSKILGKDSEFLLIYYIETYELNLVLNKYAKSKKIKSVESAILLHSININDLYSGNYNIVIEVRDKHNKLQLKKKHFFQRSSSKIAIIENNYSPGDSLHTFANQYLDIDSLQAHILCLKPISSQYEYINAVNICNNDDIEKLQNFLYQFWYKRNKNNPEKEWYKYKTQVAIAEMNFSTRIKKGYLTDRGRVFLEYGPPNIRMKKPYEEGTLPYEIWQYYEGKKQRNIKFVFCNTFIATKDYVLLHSNATGEMLNYNWPARVLDYIDNYSQERIDETESYGYQMEKLRENYTNPH